MLVVEVSSFVHVAVVVVVEVVISPLVHFSRFLRVRKSLFEPE